MGKTSWVPSRTYTGTMGMCLLKSDAMRSQCVLLCFIHCFPFTYIHILPSLVFNVIHLQEKFHENGSNLNIYGHMVGTNSWAPCDLIIRAHPFIKYVTLVINVD